MTPSSRAVVKLAMVTVAGLFFSCSSVELKPTPKHPLGACAISCPQGFFLREQHLCHGGKRWFQDISVIGQHTTRGPDGTKNSDVWITKAGDYDKQDVVFGTCANAMREAISKREKDQRGIHPGEDEVGRPKYE